VILKKKGINCEYITEYAKDKTWENSSTTLSNQIYIFGKQHHKMFIVKDKVDVMICDSPLLFSIIYDNNKTKKGDHFYEFILEEFNKFNNLNFYIERTTQYNPTGRNQTENQALIVDESIKSLLIYNNIDFHIYNRNIVKTEENKEISNTANDIVEKILKRI
jgi:hypothetical protein